MFAQSAPQSPVGSPMLAHASRPSLASPFLTPQPSSATVPQLPFPWRKRLLLPTIRRITENGSPKPSFMKSSPHKRSRSVSANLQSSPPDHATTMGNAFDSLFPKFEVVEDQIEMEGYQIYAVEKWVVERTRPVTVLVVYTGDVTHRITVTAFAPLNSLSPAEAQEEWKNMLSVLRRDGTRSRETENGTLMVTSLANFRSDLTIVLIPRGNYVHVWERLYTNINLLRMGCSGRSALTLQEPSDTTKDRFLSMYYIQDKARSKELFNATVLELVKFIQSGLAIFGMLDFTQERDGLLCDITVEGIQKWIVEIGEPFVHVEPTERLADPSVVSALLSLVLTMRNKLYDLGFGQVVPRDPLLDPGAFVNALSSFSSSRHSPTFFQVKYATAPIIDALNAAHDKFRQAESYKPHRVLKSKLDDLTTDLRATPNEKLISPHTLGATPELSVFVSAVLSGGKSEGVSLRYLWSGRPFEIQKRKREKVNNDGEREDDYEREKFDGKSTDDEPEFSTGNHWSGRMQRKIESWKAIGRNKKTSLDFGSKGWSSIQPTETASQSSRTPQGPTVIISGEDEEIISSGQASPIWEQQTAASSAFAFDKVASAHSSVATLSDYDRKLTEFNQKRPPFRYPAPQRVMSWSDPVSMRVMSTVPSQMGRTDSSGGTEGSWDALPEMTLIEGDVLGRIPLINRSSQRRKSFSDPHGMTDIRILPLDRMKIDVELCGQLLIMRRREMHLQNAIACLRELTSTLSETNSHLREEYQAHNLKLDTFLQRANVIDDIETAVIKANSITQEVNALEYECEQFRMEDLWQTANPPRQKVTELRQKVFGTGRRFPQGVSNVHGQFNRLQWTLDGKGRLVDSLGRTESEVEEESELEDVIPSKLDEQDDEGGVQYSELKPIWLLRLFTNWGRKFGLVVSNSKKTDDQDPAKSSAISSASSTNKSLS